MTCLECKHYCYDELFDSETGEEYDMGYCKIGNETDGYTSKACDDFAELKGDNKNETDN
jgi:hypothetical protein